MGIHQREKAIAKQSFDRIERHLTLVRSRRISCQDVQKGCAYLLGSEGQIGLQFCFCHTLPMNALIVLLALVRDFFNQVSWRNSKYFGELSKGDGGGCIEGV